MSSTPVEVTRTGNHTFTATNPRGGRVEIGREDAPDAFTPGELLLAAIAACSAVTGENLVTRRLGEDAAITVHADRSKAPEDPHRFSSVQVSFDAALAEIDDEAERDKLVEALQRAIGKYCTVSRSVEEGTPVNLGLR
ncbi:OsmC family protein [Saccharopolyspora rosea]|uniref:OsmC family protein n=1 Tax=Saccharopolyspora rosea TaxID=524884 RepID=UPI0021DA475F|nr:OsmC family protein [Saccharopolyspora rosea]